ncbi:MAG: PIG-L family deacetylase [Candidatus Omnitrophota bacterium]
MIYYILFFLLFFFSPLSAAEPLVAEKLGEFNKGERILILAPHPDDEVIGCAGIIQEAIASGARVKIVYLTNGEHNQFVFIVYKKRVIFRQKEFISLGEVRRQESIEAMKLLGIGKDDLIFLGYPDFGTFSIFARYWDTDKPFYSLMTRISKVPYKSSISFGSPYVGESIIADLKRVILDYQPQKIFVSHPADVNVDHKSFYLFLQIALADLRGKIQQPQVYPYLIHHVGWPLPRRYHPELSLAPPKGLSDSQIEWLEFVLSSEQLAKKRQAILTYKSQTTSSAFYLLSFARKNELFGDYPPIFLNNQPKDKKASYFGFLKMFLDTDFELKEKKEGRLFEEGERVSYALLDKSLVIKIEKPKNIVRRFSTVSYIFGYNYKSQFSLMPKVRIVTKYNKFKAFDGKKQISLKGASLELEPTALILKIPLASLGSPDFLLVSVRAYIGKEEESSSPIYTTGFRRIDIN